MEKSLIEQLLELNKNLEQQIDTLRLRLEVDAKHHEEAKKVVVSENDHKLKQKDKEIETLKDEVKKKGERIDRLTIDNEEKDKEISELQRQIQEMKKEVENAQMSAGDLRRELTTLHHRNRRLECGSAYGDKDRKINALTREVDELRTNLAILEKELEKAREVISTQGSKLRLFENDKVNMQIKFKGELAKVSHSMRLEIEKMRDVMSSQWQEMKSLREQNAEMSRDIKEIRDLLVMSHTEQTVDPKQGYCTSPFKPTLPTLKRSTTAKKK
ncbi:hypothetical protein KUTeg_017024 [Tegillarca granosa]|uniref:Uncharacterized protein n=1 Tax=Tegillarca granosa TaxID=220873 RepID=A0ABQ9ENG5_TEGGR|nr:hypothetical protein KUTeg_017024 [Tegillarca granosa]